jgi:hypothetical protein
MQVLRNRLKKSAIRGKGKSGGDAEDVYLVPPQTTDVYRSAATLRSLDVLCEGPIEGLCLNDGTRADGIDVFGAVYFDETPIKENTSKTSQIAPFSASNIQFAERASLSSLNTALGNIQTNLGNLINGTDTSLGLASIAHQGVNDLTSEFSELFSNFDEYESLINQLGIIQFDLSGVLTSSNSTSYSNAKSPISPKFFLGDSTHERCVKVKNGEQIIKLPENIFAFSPTFNTGDSFVGDDSVFDFYRVNNYIGGGIMFFFIGDEVSTGSGGEFLTGKFLTTVNNTAAIQNGKDNGYDVIGTGNSFVEFLNVPSGQVNPAKGETIGKQLNLAVNIDNNLRFNFNKVKVEHTKGDEFQKSLGSFEKIIRDYQIQRNLLGPFDLDAGGDTAAVSSETLTDQFGNSVTIQKAGLGNDDLRTDGSFGANFATWNNNVAQEHEGYDYTHIIYQNEVDSVSPILNISLLKDTEQADDNTLGRAEPAGLTFQFEIGFEGDGDGSSLSSLLEQGVDPKFIILRDFKVTKRAAYYGIVEGGYINAPYDEIVLPKNSELKNLKVSDIAGITAGQITTYGLDANEILYPNESWKDVRRYIKIKKTSYETESALIQRECGLYAVTEKINSKFSYPFSSLVGTTLEARSFSQPPVRTYDAKLKKILIPSNYVPLKADGSDKRFVNNANKYGSRDIFRFNGSTYIKIPEKIELGTENYEISFKVKFGNFNTSTSAVYFIDVDGGDFATPGRVAVYHRDNGGGSSPEIGMIGKDHTGATDFSTKDVSISAYSTSDVFTVSLKAIGSTYTLTVKVGETLVGTQTGTLTNRPSFSYDPASGKSLLIGASTTKTASSFQDNGTQIADFKIKKNNQLLHFFDGTVIETERLGSVFKDKFSGAHGDIVGTSSTLEDLNFQFGRNKEQIYIGEWDGTFKYAWSDNPAWILYDLMVNPVYGIRNQIDDLEDIDIFELYEIARYCDGVDSDGGFDGLSDDRGGLEPRFSCNILLNQKENAFNLIGNIASIFRCVTYWGGGAFNFSIDRPKDEMAVFNNSNVLDGAFSYGDILKQSRFTRVEVFYSDKNDFYRIKKEYVEDEERIRNYGIITNTQNGIGATSRSQARRLGNYILLSNKLETETIEFTTDHKALALSPGDVIRVDDDLKNFEINYGKILNSSFSENEFYVEVENALNTGSIKTGQDSAIYLYKNTGQTEIQTLYDIAKFDQSYSLGDDLDIYSGTLALDKIASAYEEFIFKSEITGISLTNNAASIKLDLKVDENAELYGEKIKNGSPFNVKLNNDVNEFYKVVNVKQQEDNTYAVNGLQYNQEKFDAVELEDYTDIEEEYNIGIPNNRINRPSPPDSFQFNTVSQNGSLYLTGAIFGNATGQETKYRVSLRYPNGSYAYKEFLKDTQFSPPVTLFDFYNIAQVGSYDVTVTSMRNPESTDSPSKSFTIDSSQFSDISFKEISLNKQINGSEVIADSIKYKTGESITENDNFNISIKNDSNASVSFSSHHSPYLNIKLFNKENEYVKDLVGKYRSPKFNFTQLNKKEILDDQRSYTLGFYLYNSEDQLKGTCMYSVKNQAPSLVCKSEKAFSDKIVFDLNLQGSLDAKKIDVYSSYDGQDFSKLKTQNLFSQSETIALPVYYSEIKTYNDVVYKFVPHDIVGTGTWSNSVTGSISKAEESTNQQIPFSQISQQLDQSLVSVYFAQFNGHLSGEYYSNGSQSYNFIEFDADGRQLGYNVVLDSSYSYSGSGTQRSLDLNNVVSLDLTSPDSSGVKTSYKKKKSVWQTYGNYDFALSLTNNSGISIDQVNLEIEKFYK